MSLIAGQVRDNEHIAAELFPIERRRLFLGSIELDFPVVQAALSGYSDWPMRIISRRCGAPYALCEVMLGQFLIDAKPDRKKNRHFFKLTAEDHPVGGQLMGDAPEQFAPGARRLVDAGFDVIDINFGCPVRSGTGRCRGGFHLSQPDVALEIIDRVREAVPDRIPVTLKMRRGIDDSKQSRDNFFEIFDGAYNRGIAAITVHGRTVLQRYKGPSDWQALREIKRHAGQRIVLGSGDLFTAQDCRNMMVETGVDGVTVARGAIGNPWIFRDARALMDGKPIPTAPSLAEQRDVIGEHFRLSQEIYGPDRCVTQMRKFGIRYSQMHPQPDSVRDAFVNAKQPEQWWGVLRKWYDEFEDPSSIDS